MEQRKFQAREQVDAGRLLDIGDGCATFVLHEDGVITECSDGALALFQAKKPTIIGRHISEYVPHFSSHMLVRAGALDPQLDYLCHCGTPFRARRVTGEPFVCELFFFDHGGAARHSLRLIVREVAGPDLARTSNSWCLE